MLNFTPGELITLLVLLPLVGGVIGYVIAADRMRRHSGGKTPAELKTEFDDYQRGVGNHFQHSAELLQQMTQQYREIYTHMAHGAAELCGDGHNSPEVEALQRLSVALDDAAAVPGEDAEQTTAKLGSDVSSAPAQERPTDQPKQTAENSEAPEAEASELHTNTASETAVELDEAAPGSETDEAAPKAAERS